LATQILEESERKLNESENLKNELIKAKLAEKSAKEKLLEFLTRSTCAATTIAVTGVQTINGITTISNIPNGYGRCLSPAEPEFHNGLQSLRLSDHETPVSPPMLGSYDLHNHLMQNMMDAHVHDNITRQLSLEIEKDRVEYMQKSKHLQDQLRDLSTEIDVLRVEERQTLYDQKHMEQMRMGENKYSTLKKTKAGSTRARVAFFEEL